MDVQAKDRLTGAVILVVLVVLLVPELLSGPGIKVATVTPAPTDAAPLRSYTMELGDESRTHHAASPSPANALALPPVVMPPPAAVKPQQDAPVKLAATLASPLQPAVAAQPAAPPPVAPGGWTVQLGSFASRVNAERLVHELKAKGYASFWTESASGGRKFYRVRVGPAMDRASAEALAAKLRAGGHSGSLTQHP